MCRSRSCRCPKADPGVVRGPWPQPDPVLGFYGPGTPDVAHQPRGGAAGRGAGRAAAPGRAPARRGGRGAAQPRRGRPVRAAATDAAHDAGPGVRRRPDGRAGGAAAQRGPRRGARAGGGPRGACGDRRRALPRHGPGAAAVGPGDAHRDQRRGVRALGGAAHRGGSRGVLGGGAAGRACAWASRCRSAPPDWAALEAYWDADGGAGRPDPGDPDRAAPGPADPAARRCPWRPAPVVDLLALPGLALLPARIRDAYGIAWGPRRGGAARHGSGAASAPGPRSCPPLALDAAGAAGLPAGRAGAPRQARMARRAPRYGADR